MKPNNIPINYGPVCSGGVIFSFPILQKTVVNSLKQLPLFLLPINKIYWSGQNVIQNELKSVFGQVKTQVLFSLSFCWKWVDPES